MELNNIMQLWMASGGYTVVQEKNYPTAAYGAATVGTIFCKLLGEKTHPISTHSMRISLSRENYVSFLVEYSWLGKY
jgi:hypothetical protein